MTTDVACGIVRGMRHVVIMLLALSTVANVGCAHFARGVVATDAGLNQSRPDIDEFNLEMDARQADFERRLERSAARRERHEAQNERDRARMARTVGSY